LSLLRVAGAAKGRRDKAQKESEIECKVLAQANGEDREKRQSREADGVLGRIIRKSMVHPGG